jgi:hypothetical protein
MQQKVAVGLVSFVVTVLIAGLALPGEWQVERELIVRGPSPPLNEAVIDLSTWSEWSQWRSGVVNGLQLEYPGSMAGVGAVQTWQGGEIASGLLRITEVDAGGGIRFDLERGSLASRAQLLFEEFGSDTRVVWREEGDLGVGPISGWRGLMLDGLLGPGIERQLAGLSAYAERAH